MISMLMVQRELSSKRTQMKVIKTNEIEILRSEWCNNLAPLQLRKTSISKQLKLPVLHFFLCLFIFQFVELCEFFSSFSLFHFLHGNVKKLSPELCYLGKYALLPPLDPWARLRFWRVYEGLYTSGALQPSVFCTYMYAHRGFDQSFVCLIDWLYQQR